MKARLYVLTKITPGDYMCVANDAKTIWRFDTYFDGRRWGLVDADYAEKLFWRARWRPATDLAVRPDTEEAYFSFMEEGWQLYDMMLATRREAIEVMLENYEKVSERIYARDEAGAPRPGGLDAQG